MGMAAGSGPSGELYRVTPNLRIQIGLRPKMATKLLSSAKMEAVLGMPWALYMCLY